MTVNDLGKDSTVSGISPSPSFSPIAMWATGKGSTLQRLAPALLTVKVDPGYLIDRSGWADADCVSAVTEGNLEVLESLSGSPVIVRSNAHEEDGHLASNAGRYESVILAGEPSPEDIITAIRRLFASYKHSHADDAVFLQRYVDDAAATAVVTTSTLGIGAPYWTIAIDNTPVGTNGVTSGVARVTTWYILRTAASDPYGNAPADSPQAARSSLGAFLQAAAEVGEAVKALAGCEQELDMEFLLGRDGEVSLLQVRPLVLPSPVLSAPSARGYASVFSKFVHDAAQDAQRLIRVHGTGGLLSNTTDWNPAEMLGQRPRALAASLYRHAITDYTWAQQRAEYGYRNLYGTPLMHLIAEQPYIDVGASLLSFIPPALDDGSAQKLLAAQLTLLCRDRSLHRSVEFAVAITCADFTLHRKLASGPAEALRTKDRQRLGEALGLITTNAIARLALDQSAAASAKHRRLQLESIADPVRRLSILLDEVPERAALPFAHIARSAFIATSFLRSSCDENLADEQSVAAFMRGIGTVSTRIRRDGRRVHDGELSWQAFIDAYGHLRPGTYDLREHCYRDDPESFLRPFVSVADEPHLINQHDIQQMPSDWFTADKSTVHARLLDIGITTSPNQLHMFVRDAIRERESAKFEYAAWISDILDALLQATSSQGVTRQALTHWTVDDIVTFCCDGRLPPPVTTRSRRDKHNLSSLVHLPAVIGQGDDLTFFAEPPGAATYVGGQLVTARAHHDPNPFDELTGAIIVVEQADPGWEWLFSQQVSGVITAQGGANSHLAVRCAELGIPAAIGIGEDALHRLRAADMIRLDCANKTVKVLR